MGKHGLSFELAAPAMLDPCSIEHHAEGEEREDRYVLLGQVVTEVLVALYPMSGDTYRIISAREAESHEYRTA